MTFEGHPSKILGPSLPMPSTLTLALPSLRRRAISSGLPASWGLSLTLGQPPMGPSLLAWRRNPGDWRPPSTNARLTCRQATTRAHLGGTAETGRENGQGPASPLRPSNAPCQNPWSHAPLAQQPQLGPPSRYPQSRRLGPASLLVSNPNLRSAPEGPFPRAGASTLGIGDS